MRRIIAFFLGLLIAAPAFAGSLTGSVTNYGQGNNVPAFDLTALTSAAGSDWETTAAGGVSFGETKNGATGLSSISAVGGATIGGGTSPQISKNWSDGTPVAAGTADQGICYAGGAASDGMTFTALADTTQRTLYIYAGSLNDTLIFSAHLNDSSAADYTDNSLVNTVTYNYTWGLYTITYTANSTTTLQVTVKTTGTGYVAVTAAYFTPGAPAAPVLHTRSLLGVGL